jgi:Holliday junction resolvasome RuvABC endonuclease subunit
MKPQTILGIDSSTHSTGWAIITVKEPVKLIAYGKITSDKEEVLLRWQDMVLGLDDVLKVWGKPDAVAIEEPNSFRGGEVTRSLTGLFGIVVYHLFSTHGLWATQINTSHSKSVFCGKGVGKGKEPTIARANQLFGLNLVYYKPGTKNSALSDDDIADAIQQSFTLRKDLLETVGSGFTS